MSSFDQLHPALQHHIVNSLGWRELRPFQEDVIPRVLSGNHQIILAPTAGGKTEAAIFPTLSRMLTENWTGLSVLYLCPIKALINNLDLRLQRYCELLGRRSAVWHGDVGQGERRRILREPPDCLLTTPESLEVMLVSQKINKAEFFANLQVVIVDEIHAFAGDDRGWHLLAVLERASRFAGRQPQRIGLSATVGNPHELGKWLAGFAERETQVYLPDKAGSDQAEVQLDYVGSLENAAVVISRLHRGEKRLVFVDGRKVAEELGTALRKLEISTFVTHSSLSQEQRRMAEEAFASRSDCVIVATSVLELGVDVGDLDRVIQIDAPMTVSSFLQRMGRTGRREGLSRNCLFLITKSNLVAHATALLDLWKAGYVEPAIPPASPYHILSQQLMALAMQQRGIGIKDWFEWVKNVQGFQQMAPERIQQIVEWMQDNEILWNENGILWFGKKGEDEFGRFNFMDLFSVFMTPPLFTILHGRLEIGYVDQMVFTQQKKKDEPQILLLGGRGWNVTHVDWKRKKAYVEPTEVTGKAKWLGSGQGLNFRLAQAIKHVLAKDDDRPFWSTRARELVAQVRMEHAWLEPDDTVVVNGPGDELEWWTFGGTGANASLATAIREITGESTRNPNAFYVCLPRELPITDVSHVINQLHGLSPNLLVPAINPEAITGLKFSSCLPMEVATEMLQHRLMDPDAVSFVLNEPLRIVASRHEE